MAEPLLLTRVVEVDWLRFGEVVDIIIPYLKIAELQRHWGEENPSIMDLRGAEFVRYFAEGVREEADQTAVAYRDVISAAVVVHIERDWARLDFPGASLDEGLKFRLDLDGVWRLHCWPMFACNLS